MSRQLENDSYQNDHRLIQAYEEATCLDQEGLKTLCPSYAELSETSTRYANETLIGKGGIKQVYRIFDNRTRRWVAIARLRDDRGPEHFDLFVNEAWMTSSLKHPNIINVHDVGIDSDGRPFFTMDLKGNRTLADLIKADDQERRALLEVFLKICDAMAYAHSREIIHLDLKPANIQSDAFGEVLVCDWGLSKIVSDKEEASPLNSSSELLDNMTLVGEVKGSPGFMAPEQVEKSGRKDHRTDIFSLGCILHTILTGESPFTGSHRSILDATLHDKVTNLGEKFPSLKIPASLEAITLKALAKNPNQRYQSVSALRRDVERYLDGFSANAEDSSFLREAKLFAARNRTPVLISFFSLILLSVLSTLFFQKVDFLSRSIQQESQLADQYATEAELAKDRYVETVSESKQQNIALSQSLLSSVSTLKNRGIFHTPMKSIREALLLANHAHTLHPENAGPKYQLFALNLIQLNCQEALKYPLPKGSHRYDYMKLAEDSSDFDFHRHKRPALEILSQFLAQAQELAPNQSAIIERIISYDAALRSSKKAYTGVIEEFLRYLNPENTEIALKYTGNAEITLSTNEPMRMISDPGGSEKCVLRYLEPQNLSIRTEGKFELLEIHGLTIRQLDLTECATFKLEQAISLPSLEKVIIDSKSHSVQKLRAWIQCKGDFEIVGTSN